MMFFDLFVGIFEMIISLPFIPFLLILIGVNYYLTKYFPIIMDFKHFEHLSQWTQNDYIIVGINIAIVILFFIFFTDKKRK